MNKKIDNYLNYENLCDDKNNMPLIVVIIKLSLLNNYSNRAQKENQYNKIIKNEKFNDFDMNHEL